MMCDQLILFSVEHEFGKLFFMVRDVTNNDGFCDLRRTQILTDIQDFTSLLSVTLRCESPKWLELSTESDIGTCM